MENKFEVTEEDNIYLTSEERRQLEKASNNKIKVIPLKHKNVSIPEPPPINAGVEVTPELKAWIERQDIENKEEMLQLVTMRYNYGMNKYGQPLMTLDG